MFDDYLIGVGTRVAFANTADTRSPIVTEDISCVVGSAKGFEIAQTGCVGVALAITTRMRIVAVANTAFQVSTVIALFRLTNVSLEIKNRMFKNSSNFKKKLHSSKKTKTYWISWAFTITITKHFQIDEQRFVNAHWINLEQLPPLPRIGRTTSQLTIQSSISYVI